MHIPQFSFQILFYLFIYLFASSTIKMLCNFLDSLPFVSTFHFSPFPMIANFKPFHSLKDSTFDFLSSLPTSLLSLLLLFLLTYNGLYVFSIFPPSPPKIIPQPAGLSPEKRWSNLSSNLVSYSVEEKHPPAILKSNSSVFHKPHFKIRRAGNSAGRPVKRVGKHKRRLRSLRPELRENEFSARVEEFFAANSCKLRFFMTWISALDSFRDRELWAIQSIFKAHENGSGNENPCLIIVSNSLDSTKGKQILSPISNKGFPIIPISPDFDSIFRNTEAEPWFNQLRQGIIKPGEISLGQNLSNLLRLALLYKFGGIYIDTDMIILKSFTNLRNVIGAQTIDLKTGNWSRLNNAVMIFDKNHPLLLKFIEEFASTFDGNKWGHNGPYLVSRVVSRLNQNREFNFSVLPPSAFYPVVWSRIRTLFQGPKDGVHMKWLIAKLRHIRSKSLALHLWNRHSRKLEVEKGSIVDIIRWNSCVV